MLPKNRMRRGLALSLALLSAGCAHESRVPAPSETTPPVAQSIAPQASGGMDGGEVAAPIVIPGAWSEAIRWRRWADAARLIDALPVDQRQRPEVKFARARVAVALGDHATAAKLYDKLEAALPLLGGEIERERAESQLVAGPHEPAARYFASRGNASDFIKAARAFERAGKLAEARSAADRAVGLAALANGARKKEQPSPTEIEARHVRAAIAEKQGKTDVAATDLRWLATFAPTSSQAGDVDAKLAELAPKRVLSARERYERALAMAEDGQLERVERELAELERAPGPKITKAERLHAQGIAQYRARRYVKAAELLELASEAGGPRAAEDLFHAARARSRAHQDDRAIQLYGKVTRKFPKTSYAEQAQFLSARLLYIGGRWREAADAYGRYTSRHAKGSFVERVQREQAIAWLAGGRHDRAAKALGRLASSAERDHERAHLSELEGVALALSGKQDAAVRTLRGVIEDYPLSFGALAAATRLGAMKQPVPPPIEPAKSGSPRGGLEVPLPPKARLLRDLGLDGDAERAIGDLEELIRKKHAPRGDEALCQLYGQLSEASRRYRVGQKAVRAADLNRAPASDTRWMWDCIYPRPYEDLVRAAEKEFSLPRDLAYAVMRQESAFAPAVVSPAKAVGLMQLIPPTAENAAREIDVAFEPLLLASPSYNIRVGSYYLSKVLGTFGGNVALAAAAYNAGPSSVSRWLETGEGLPLDVFVARIPYDETRVYVTRVIGNMARYSYLDGGDPSVPQLALEIPKGLRAKQEDY